MIEKTIGVVGITAVVLLALASAGTAQDSPSTVGQEERTGEIVRAYLLKHPEIIDEAMQALRERRAAEVAAKTSQALKEHRDALLADPISPVVGDPDGKVTVVEFFDYNCAYCRKAFASEKSRRSLRLQGVPNPRPVVPLRGAGGARYPPPEPGTLYGVPRCASEG